MYLAVILGSYSHPRHAHLRHSSRDLQMALDTGSRGWGNPAKLPQLGSGHRHLPSAPSQARARQGFLVLHGFVTERFIPPEQPKGILAWPSIGLSRMCAPAVCFRSQAILCEHQCKWGSLLRRLVGLVLPLSAGDNQPSCKLQGEEGAHNTRVGVYGGVCSPVPLLIQGHPAPLWACNCSEPGFSIYWEAGLSSAPHPHLWELVADDTQAYNKTLQK